MVISVPEIIILHILKDHPKSYGKIHDTLVSYGVTLSYGNLYHKLRQLRFEHKISRKRYEDYQITKQGLATLNTQISILAPIIQTDGNKVTEGKQA